MRGSHSEVRPFDHTKSKLTCASIPLRTPELATRFHDHGGLRGAGCDCATFLLSVFEEAGLIARPKDRSFVREAVRTLLAAMRANRRSWML